MVGLTEYKNKDYHCFIDSKERYQGVYKSWWSNGQIWDHKKYLNDELHGEAKYWNKDGELQNHCFWVRGKLYRDLIDDPVCGDEEKFLIALETGASWLD